MENFSYEWSFSDEKNRWKFWYIIAISIVLGISIWWIITNQYWLTAIVLLIAWISFFIENNSSDNINVKINEIWIKIWDYFYDYQKIEKFWFIYNNENAEYLRLNMKKSAIKNIDLKIDNKIYTDLKNILPNFLEEAEKTELTKIEKLIKILKL